MASHPDNPPADDLDPERITQLIAEARRLTEMSRELLRRSTAERQKRDDDPERLRLLRETVDRVIRERIAGTASGAVRPTPDDEP